MSVKHKCVVCGRPFPAGQGIILKYGDLTISFHSSRCASRFFKALIERVPPEELKPYVRKIVEEYEDFLSQREKARVKKL
ncbi:MAG: hypothetical protein QXW58_01465 [Thermosphaera sp.]